VVDDVARGEVWWVEFPGAGRRPAVVLSRDRAIPVLNKIIVAPATRSVRGIPTEVALGPDDGMPDACALSLDNVTMIPKRALRARICTLGIERMLQVCSALRVAVDC
jgi:mRNA interferase MazF